MAKYAISQEGAEAMRQLSEDITSSLDGIGKATVSLQNQVMGLIDELGVYGFDIWAITLKINGILEDRKEALFELAGKAKAKSEEILGLIELSTISSSKELKKNISNVENKLEEAFIDGRVYSFPYSEEGLPKAYRVTDRVNAKTMWQQSINNVDMLIENYREALLARGVPNGVWMNETLASHRAAMLEQEGYNLDVVSGHQAESVNNSNAYSYPIDYGAFYDQLAAEYRAYAISHHDVVNGRDLLTSFNYDASSGIRAGQQAAEAQGYLGRPQILSKSEFHNKVRESGVIAFRTYSGGKDVVTGETKQSSYFVDSLKYSDEYILNGNGYQYYGEGTYFAINHGAKVGEKPDDISSNAAYDDSNAYGNVNDKTTVIATIRKDAVIKNYEEVFREFNRLSKKEQLRFGGTHEKGIGAFAISQGIDGLVHEFDDLDYLILYNRTKLIVLEDS